MDRTRRAKFPKSGAISIALQDFHIRGRFPGFIATVRPGSGIWQGILQPRDVSPAYHVVVQYTIARVPPKVTVTQPKLRPNPHLYPDGSLCLYWPKEWTWSRREIIAETILPWAAVWLLYYELWLDTGEWLGPSSHDPHKRPGEPDDG